MIKAHIYESKYKYELGTLLTDYFNEREGGCVGNTITAIDTMLNNGRHIYIFTKDDEVVGFIVMYINNQYGLATPNAVNEYMYVKPEHRSSMVTKQVLLQLLSYCNDLDLDLLGVVYNDSPNIGNYKYLGGNPVATIVTTSKENLKNKFNKLMKRS